MSKVVFVGNVPYNMGEDQLIDVFKSVGQVVGFRLVFDRETGKPRGYGFYHETALSAVRNLNGADVGGRPLRIDLADSDPFLEGKTTVRGELMDGGYPGPSEPRSRSGRGAASDPELFLANLPPGKPLLPGQSALDSISQTLASMPPSQLMEVLAQMKAFVITHPDQARLLLVKHPQLSYALFQALLLNKIVDSAILERMLASSRGPNLAAAAAAAAAHPSGAPAATATRPGMAPPVPHIAAYPPASTSYPSHLPSFPTQPPPVSATTATLYPHQPPAQPFYRPPVTPIGAQPPPTSVTTTAGPPQPPAPGLSEINESQRAMLMQVLSLTQDQINALGEHERTAIMQLRNQFMGTLSTTT